jgi:hypothetical protein
VIPLGAILLIGAIPPTDKMIDGMAEGDGLATLDQAM